MYVTYMPEDGDAQRWTFDDKKVRASEAELIEKRYGDNWDTWRANVQSGSMRARRVLLWHLLRKEHHTLRWEDTPDFYAGELEIEYSVAELREIRERVEKARDQFSEDQYQQVLTGLDYQLSEAIAKEEAAGVEPEGKALSSGDGKSTGQPSPKRSTSRRGTSETASPQTS